MLQWLIFFIFFYQVVLILNVWRCCPVCMVDFESLTCKEWLLVSWCSWCYCLSWRPSCACSFYTSRNKWTHNKTKQIVDGLRVCALAYVYVWERERDNFVKVDYNYKHNRIQKTVLIILFIMNRNQRNQRKILFINQQCLLFSQNKCVCVCVNVFALLLFTKQSQV